MISRGLTTQFPLIFEAIKHGLLPGITLSASDFVRTLLGTHHNTITLLTNLDKDDTATDEAKRATSDHKTGVITQTTYDGYIHRNVNVSHIE